MTDYINAIRDALKAKAAGRIAPDTAAEIARVLRAVELLVLDLRIVECMEDRDWLTARLAEMASTAGGVA